MKRLAKWLIVIATVCLLVFAAAACDSCGEHQHTFSGAYEYDDVGHWQNADCGHDVKSPKEAHTYKDGKCSVCGRPEDKEHEHTFPDTYEYDKDGHWKKANCGHNVTTEKKPHTYEGGVCTVCGRPEDQAHEHTFSEAWESNGTHHWHEPTCGDTEEKGSYGEHDYATTEIVALTCDTDGVNRLTCKDCGFTKVETVKASHLVTDDDHHAAVTATCEHAGNIEYWECARCNKKFSDKALTSVVTEVNRPMLEHNFELVRDKAATCTEYGLKVEKCSMCKTERNTTTEPLGHKWDGKKTCTTGRTCERAGCTASEPELGHDYTLIASVDVDCTHDGSETYACGVCGDRYTTITAHSTGHSVAEWEMKPYNEVVEAATYDASSYGECTYVQVGICENENCPEHEHIVVNLDVTVDRHDYTVSVTTPATCVAEGVKTYTCGRCHDTHTEPIPPVADAHTWVKSGEEGSKITYSCSNNGCNATKTAINAKNDVQTTVSADDLKANELELRNASLDFKNVENIPASAQVSVETINKETLGLDQDVKDKISGDVYDFAMIDEVDNNRVTDFDGKSVTVRVPYTLGDGEDPESIAIWYITNEGVVDTIKAAYTVVDGQGYAVFETKHFSYYTVTQLSNEERCALYGHSYVSVHKAKTCISDGYTLNTCRRCGNVEKTDIEVATGHVYDETSVAATCTHSGSITRSCKNCDYSYTSTVPATGHSLVKDEEKSREATCLVSGITYHTCENCHKEFVTTTAQKEHNYTDVVKEATCTEGGSRSRTCKDCGFKTVDSVTEALGHKYAVTGSVAATCDTDGKIDYKCSRCNGTHTEVIKKTGHVWDIDEPTCGRSQICIVCAKVGLPATNEHSMTDGRCTVCGLGCTHKNETTVVAPTCTERGYTLVKCTICSQEERIGYKPALGHSGNFECTRCHTSLVGDDYFVNLLNSLISSEYTLKLTDFKVTDANYGNENSLVAEELYIGLDEDGNMCAYGTVAVTEGDRYGLGSPVYRYTVAVENGMVYAVGTTNGTSTWQGGASGFTDDAQTTYICAPIENFGRYISFDYASMVPGCYEWLRTDFKKIIDSLILVNKAAVSNVVGSLTDKIFTLSTSGSDYTLTLNAEGAAEINDILYANSIKDSFDKILGDGMYAKLRAEIEDVLKHETGKTLKAKLAYRGVNVDDLIQSCDNLCAVLFGEDVTLDMALEQMTGFAIDGGIRSIFENDKLMLEIVGDIMGGEFSAEEILAQIDEYASANLYELIGGGSKEGIKKEVDAYIDLIADIGNLTLTTDRNGNLKSGFATAFGPFEELEVDGELEILIGRQTKLDYDALVAGVKAIMNKVVLDEEHFGAYWNELGAETSYYESGSIQSARYTERHDHLMNLSEVMHEYQTEYLEYRKELEEMNVDGGYTIMYVIRDDMDINLSFGEQPMISLMKDCGEWYTGRVSSDSSSQTTAAYGQQVLKAVNGNGNPVMKDGKPFEKVLYEGKPSDDEYGRTMNFFVSGVSGAITTVDDTSYSSLVNQYTRHTLVEDKSLRVEATGCDGVGIKYYSCSDCGKRIAEKYVNGHGAKGYYYRVKGGVAVTDCTKGFDVERVCAVCDKVVETRHASDHELFTQEIINLTKYGMYEGCGGYATLYGCFCGKEPLRLRFNDNNCDFEVSWKYNHNWDDRFGVYTCSVTDPEPCNLRYSVKYYTEGCEVRCTYIFGCNADGTEKQGSRKIDVLYQDKHDFERVGELRPTDEPCIYEVEVKCRVCGKTETERVEHHEHTGIIPDKELGFCLYEGTVRCKDCGREIGYREDYDHRNVLPVTIEPTCTQYGMTGICEECGAGVGLIEPLGHDFNGANGECTRCGLDGKGVDGRISLEDFTASLGDSTNYVIGYFDRKVMLEDYYRFGTYNSMYGYRLDLYFEVKVEIVFDNDGGEKDTRILEGVNATTRGDNKRGEVNGHYVSINKAEVENAATELLTEMGLQGTNYNVRITFNPIDGTETTSYSITLT